VPTALARRRHRWQRPRPQQRRPQQHRQQRGPHQRRAPRPRRRAQPLLRARPRASAWPSSCGSGARGRRRPRAPPRKSASGQHPSPARAPRGKAAPARTRTAGVRPRAPRGGTGQVLPQRRAISRRCRRRSGEARLLALRTVEGGVVRTRRQSSGQRNSSSANGRACWRLQRSPSRQSRRPCRRRRQRRRQQHRPWLRQLQQSPQQPRRQPPRRQPPRRQQPRRQQPCHQRSQQLACRPRPRPMQVALAVARRLTTLMLWITAVLKALTATDVNDTSGQQIFTDCLSSRKRGELALCPHRRPRLVAATHAVARDRSSGSCGWGWENLKWPQRARCSCDPLKAIAGKRAAWQ
jgi:hypothetical protein